MDIIVSNKSSNYMSLKLNKIILLSEMLFYKTMTFACYIYEVTSIQMRSISQRFIIKGSLLYPQLLKSFGWPLTSCPLQLSPTPYSEVVFDAVAISCSHISNHLLLPYFTRTVIYLYFAPCLTRASFGDCNWICSCHIPSCDNTLRNLDFTEKINFGCRFHTNWKEAR